MVGGTKDGGLEVLTIEESKYSLEPERRFLRSTGIQAKRADLMNRARKNTSDGGSPPAD
jgi:hypothetical protein